MRTIAVVVGTFGDRRVWEPLADRACWSAATQTLVPDEVIHVHDDTLAKARNRGIEAAASDYIVVLDADDELDERYVEAMTVAAEQHPEGDWLYQPATLGVYPDGTEDDEPVLIEPRGGGILTGNHLVIGTMVSREQVLRLGGFFEWDCFEDWDLWIRLRIDGAQYATVPHAVYRVGVRDGGRNNLDKRTQVRTYNEIRRANLARGRELGIT